MIIILFCPALHLCVFHRPINVLIQLSVCYVPGAKLSTFPCWPHNL